jgi:hypothetical protein
MASDLERALNDRRAPWTDIEYRTKDFWVFSGEKGCLVFVPTFERFENVVECFKAAHKFGYDGVASDRWPAYCVRQDCGKEAGQLVEYPCIYMIPKYIND